MGNTMLVLVTRDVAIDELMVEVEIATRQDPSDKNARSHEYSWRSWVSGSKHMIGGVEPVEDFNMVMFQGEATPYTAIPRLGRAAIGRRLGGRGFLTTTGPNDTVMTYAAVVFSGGGQYVAVAQLVESLALPGCMVLDPQSDTCVTAVEYLAQRDM